MYVNTVLLAVSILLNGNNFSKTSQVSRCLNLGFISSATLVEFKSYILFQLFRRELSVFKREFYELEEGILDPLNDTDFFALHYVYLPRINRIFAECLSTQQSQNLNGGNNTPAILDKPALNSHS